MLAAELRFRTLLPADIDAVLAIEEQVHLHPWTRGMFIDSLKEGHRGIVMEQAGQLVGYAVVMPVLDEGHLLDIAIAGTAQQQGLGFKLIKQVCAMEKERGAIKMLLEVRRSNLAAQALYGKAGFREVGIRRGYYPAAEGREDAIVMELDLT